MPLPLIGAALTRAGAAAGEQAAVNAAGSGLASTTSALQRCGSAAKEFAGTVEDMKGQFQKTGGILHNVMSKVAAVSNFATDALTGAALAIQAFAKPIVELTALSNPAALKMFTLAANDAFAVIGRSLLPVTEALTRAMRRIGDVYATLEPVITKVTRVVAYCIDRLSEAWADMMTEAGPAIDFMADAVVRIVQVFTAVGIMFLKVAKWIQQAIGGVLSLLGYEKLKPKSGFGAAVRDVKIGSSAEQIATHAQEQAFRFVVNRGEVKEDPEIQQVNILGEIRDKLQTYLPDIPTRADVEGFIARILGGIPGLGGGGVAKGGADLGRLLASILTR